MLYIQLKETIMNNFKEKYGPWAIITGASSGIGDACAKYISEQGLNVVLVARSEGKLIALKKEILANYKVNVEVIVADLTDPEGMENIKKRTQDLEIGLLVNNAGREDSDHFLKITANKHLETIDLNIKAPLLLTHHFGKKMTTRKRGGIINMSSIVAFQGVPFIANYAGTKAYNLVFSEGIAAEFAKYNIDVLAVTPGFTNTNLAGEYDFSGLPMKPLDPSYVAARAIKSLGRKRLTIPGAMNSFLYWSGKFLFSRKMNTASFGKVFSKVLRNKL